MLEVWRQKAVRPNSQLSSANQRFSERSEMKYQVFISILFAPIIIASTSVQSLATPGKSLQSVANTEGKTLYISNNTKKDDTTKGETKKGDEPNGEPGGTVPAH